MAHNSVGTRKTRLLLAGALFLVALNASTAHAAFNDPASPDTAQVMSRLGQLETQVQTLSRSVYRGDAPPQMAGAAPAASPDASAYIDRINDLEQKLSATTGQLEQSAHQVQDLQNRLDKMQADYDMRLQALEQGKSPAAATTTQPPGSAAYTLPKSADGTVAPTTAGVQPLGTLPVNGGDATNTPDALYNSAFADIRDSKYESAETKFRQFLAQYPNHTMAGGAQYWLSETFYVRGDYKQAAKMFAQGYQDYPQSPKAPDSLLKLGLSLEKLGKKEDACLSFQQLKKQFPGDTVPANRRAVQEMKTLGCS